MIKVITFGTYDVFHVGHINLLQRAAALGDQLFVGVSTDEMNFDKKGRYPIYNQEDRARIINSLRYVNLVFDEESMDQKAEYIRKYDANILVMGDDWKGRFDMYRKHCDVVYLERTPSVSTTHLIEVIGKVAA